jgi:hypothetical protein
MKRITSTVWSYSKMTSLKEIFPGFVCTTKTRSIKPGNVDAVSLSGIDQYSSRQLGSILVIDGKRPCHGMLAHNHAFAPSARYRAVWITMFGAVCGAEMTECAFKKYNNILLSCKRPQFSRLFF